MGKSLGANVLKLLSSRVAIQAVNLLTAPILARLFLPEHFGITQIYGSISSVIVVIACLRYELSIPLGKDKREVVASFILSVFFAFIFALVILGLVPIVNEKIAQWFQSPELRGFLWILPASVIIGGSGGTLRFYASQQCKFGAIAWSDFSLVATNIFLVIPWALAIGASVTILFAGSVIYVLFGALILFAFLARNLISDFKSADINPQLIWRIAKHHKKFPIFDTWSGLLNTASAQLPPIILGLYFQKTAVGFYSLGYRLISLPMTLLGSSIAQVFFPAASKEYNETGKLDNVVNSVFKSLVQIGVFPLIALGLFGAPLFSFVFGNVWREAGIYAQLLSPWIFLIFITSPLSMVFGILGRQGTGLFFNISLISSRMLALILGAQTGSPRIALIAFTTISVIGWIFILCWILHNSGVNLWRALRILLKFSCLSLLILLPIGYFIWAWGSIYVILLGLVFGTIIYAYGVYRLEPNFQRFINRTIKIVIEKTTPFIPLF